MSKEEFTSDKIKASIEKWVGPIEDLEAEFDKIDSNAGGQVKDWNFVVFKVFFYILILVFQGQRSGKVKHAKFNFW